jgi:hypothetical protein
MYSTNVKQEQRHYYYTILALIFDRGELKLQSLGFMEDTESSDVFVDSTGMKSQIDINND